MLLTALFIAIFSIVVIVLQRPGEILAWYGNLMDKLPEYISKPLGYCEKCFAGQVALWSYFFLFDYNAFQHFQFVVYSIFFAYILSIIIYKYETFE